MLKMISFEMSEKDIDEMFECFIVAMYDKHNLHEKRDLLPKKVIESCKLWFPNTTATRTSLTWWRCEQLTYSPTASGRGMDASFDGLIYYSNYAHKEKTRPLPSTGEGLQIHEEESRSDIRRTP